MAELNATLVDKAWAAGSNAYQQAIPLSTQNGVDNMSTIYAALKDNGSLYNEFERNLINVIGKQIVRTWDWMNPLAFLKIPGGIPNGSTIQEIAMDLIEASGYDIRDSNLFEVAPHEVYSAFHEKNRADRFDMTLSTTEVMRAFNTPTGLNDYILRKLQIQRISDNYAEYQIMKQLIAVANKEDRIYRVKSSFADQKKPLASEIIDLSLAIRTHADLMTVVPTGQFNARGVSSVSQKDDLVLIVDPTTKNAMDVNVLADAFNQDKVEFQKRIIVIDEFPVAGLHAVLADRSWFVAADIITDLEFFRNGKNRTTNYYYHRHGTYSISPFSNAIFFGEDDNSVNPTVTITVTDIEAEFQNEDGDVVTVANYDEAPLQLVVKGVGTKVPSSPEIDVDDFEIPSAHKTQVTITDSAGTPIRVGKTYVDRTGQLILQKGLPSGADVDVLVTSTYTNPSGATGAAATATVSVTVA
jgi:hypothetical protein